MPDNSYQEVIKNNKLFDGIPAQNLKFEFRNDNIIRMKEGEIIFQKGDESKFTYLVIAGRVKIKVYIENKSIKLNKIEKDFFGDIEVLEDTYRRSAAVANTDCILYLISKIELRKLLSEMPELNDNIIAYNKVEIPELQITIHPDLLNKDTDKIYLHPRENKVESTIEVETIQEKNLPVRENVVIEKNEFIPETEVEESKETGKALIDSELKELPDKELMETDISDESPDELNEMIGALEASYTDKENEEFEVETEPIRDEAITDNETEEIISECLPLVEPPDEIMPEVTEEPKSGVTSELTVEPQLEISPKAMDDDKEIKWFNSEGKIEEEIIPEDKSEKEKEIFESEDEKVKYDDTILNIEGILDAVFKINSGKNEHDVYKNIINESVKLTEAQAGLFYLVDNEKKLLITEQETEQGFTQISFPIENGLTGIAAETGEIINIREPEKDFRYSGDVDSVRGVVESSLLCIPVLNDKTETIAVICIINSSSGKFRITDEEKMLYLTPHISQTLQRLSMIKKSAESIKGTNLPTLTKFITDNIRTPVLTMKYYASQIKKKNISADIRTVLNVLMDQADAIVNFLHFTLAYTEHKNDLELAEYNLKEIMDDSLSLLAEYVESRNVILYKKIENDLQIKVDKNAFYQVCFQIAKNACDAMGENGNIYITAKSSGDLINIEFRDTGPGIPEDIQFQIFEPFKSFKKENGTGLGLAIAQRIIRDHGGELTVESVPGEGATFIISLPSFGQI